jgi:hypothetical protein
MSRPCSCLFPSCFGCLGCFYPILQRFVLAYSAHCRIVFCYTSTARLSFLLLGFDWPSDPGIDPVTVVGAQNFWRHSLARKATAIKLSAPPTTRQQTTADSALRCDMNFVPMNEHVDEELMLLPRLPTCPSNCNSSPGPHRPRHLKYRTSVASRPASPVAILGRSASSAFLESQTVSSPGCCYKTPTQSPAQMRSALHARNSLQTTPLNVQSVRRIRRISSTKKLACSYTFGSSNPATPSRGPLLAFVPSQQSFTK